MECVPYRAWYRKEEDCALCISWENLPPPLHVKAKKRRDPRRVGCREAETRVQGASWKPASSAAPCALGSWAAPFQWDASLVQCGQRLCCPTRPEARAFPGANPSRSSCEPGPDRMCCAPFLLLPASASSLSSTDNWAELQKKDSLSHLFRTQSVFSLRIKLFKRKRAI